MRQSGGGGAIRSSRRLLVASCLTTVGVCRSMSDELSLHFCLFTSLWCSKIRLCLTSSVLMSDSLRNFSDVFSQSEGDWRSVSSSVSTPTSSSVPDASLVPASASVSPSRNRSKPDFVLKQNYHHQFGVACGEVRLSKLACFAVVGCMRVPNPNMQYSLL